MKSKGELLSSVIGKMMNAFALHRIILNEEGKPCNYEYIDVNPAFESFTGIPAKTIAGKRVTDILPDIGKDSIDWIEIYGRVALTGDAVTFENYSEALKKWYTVYAYSPEQGYFITIFHDITQLKLNEAVLTEQRNRLDETVKRLLLSENELRTRNEELGALYEELTASEEELRAQFDSLNEKEEAMKNLACYDQLTGLENRTSFLKRLESILTECIKCEKKAALVYIDMDNFKVVNDIMGHSYGDEVIKEFTSRLLLHLDARDTIARMGGDEFAIALYNIRSEKSVQSKVEKIRAEFNKPFVVNDNIFHITASFGITFFPKDGEAVRDLLMNADTAMHKAKQMNKNNISIYIPTMKTEILRRSNVENLLRKAIVNSEFKLYFQPQYLIRDRRLRGFEALIRWDNPETGMISPMYFIPVAEETGLITQIGDWVLEEAGRLYQVWKKQFGYESIISVNTSPVKLRNVHFADMVKRVVRQYGMDNCLELEITENIFIGQFQPVIEVLQTLKDWGVKISLDDFGTGYSSLNYLRNLPLNTLKIDRAFIANLSSRSIESHIAEGIISMVHKIGLETVAEGVEKEEQLQFLERMGCNIVQGYLTGRPVPEEEVPEIIKRDYFNIK